VSDFILPCVEEIATPSNVTFVMFPNMAAHLNKRCSTSVGLERVLNGYDEVVTVSHTAILDQKASAFIVINVSAPADIRARCAAVSGIVRSMKNFPSVRRVS
jgi:hypothetical protein